MIFLFLITFPRSINFFPIWRSSSLIVLKLSYFNDTHNDTIIKQFYKAKTPLSFYLSVCALKFSDHLSVFLYLSIFVNYFVPKDSLSLFPCKLHPMEEGQNELPDFIIILRVNYTSRLL